MLSFLFSRSEETYEELKKVKAEKKKRDEESYRDPGKAAEAKEKGNDAFKGGDFPTAIAHYSEAIKRDPNNAVYWANRAAARIKLLDWRCVQMFDSYWVYVREASATVALCIWRMAHSFCLTLTLALA